MNQDSSPPVVNYATPPAPKREPRSWIYRFRWIVLLALIAITYFIRAFVSW